MLSTTDLPDSAAGRYSYERFRVVKRRTVTEEMCNDRLRGRLDLEREREKRFKTIGARSLDRVRVSGILTSIQVN